MASEIIISAGLKVSKGGASINLSASTAQDMSGEDMLQDTQLIGTSAEAVTFGEISGAPAYIFVKNLDSTNFVTVGWTNPPTEIKILAGKFALFPTSSGTIYAVADTASVRVQKGAVEA